MSSELPTNAGGASDVDAMAGAESCAGVVQTTRQISYIGPVPPPSMLREYDEIDPGRAAKLMTLAEDQSRHRMLLEQRVIFSDIRRAYLGQVCGFAIAVMFFGGAFYLILNGHSIAGTIIGSVDLVALVSVFIYGSESRRRERENRIRTQSHGKSSS